MFARIVEGVVKQVQPNYQEGFVRVGSGVFCGQVSLDGGFVNPPPLPKSSLELADEKKLKGVEFQGVLCSATSADQVGLLAVKNWVGDLGGETNFKFSNGNVLRVTPENLTEFEMVWGAFRASFFE